MDLTHRIPPFADQCFLENNGIQTSEAFAQAALFVFPPENITKNNFQN
jgi:hypothetical protein